MACEFADIAIRYAFDTLYIPVNEHINLYNKYAFNVYIWIKIK